MSRAKQNPTTRALKAALSTRIPSYLDDRLHAYASRARYTIEEVTTEALTAYLDAQSPETKARYQPAAPAVGASEAAIAARIEAKLGAQLDAKLDQVLKTLEQGAGRRGARA